MKLPIVSRTAYDRIAVDYQSSLDQNRLLQQKVHDLQSRLSEAEVDARRGREMVADWLAQRIFGRSIFKSDAPQLPPDPVEAEAIETLGRRGRSGREIANEMTAQFFEQYNSRMSAEPKEN